METKVPQTDGNPAEDCERKKILNIESARPHLFQNFPAAESSPFPTDSAGFGKSPGLAGANS
ncbi:MAG: hypothetical protein DBX55_03385 [Verrucomicrobia bacterium]|nr:MAG: hypothetical protein DBX55_03385 [Verrucomicrobiota bacterium]